MLPIPNAVAAALVGSFTQFLRCPGGLALQGLKHLVGCVIAVFWSPLAETSDGFDIHRHGRQAGSLHHQSAIRAGLYSKARVLILDAKTQQLLPTGRLTAGAQCRCGQQGQQLARVAPHPVLVSRAGFNRHQGPNGAGPEDSASTGTQLQNRFRSPYTLSTRPTPGQYLTFFRLAVGKAAISRE